LITLKCLLPVISRKKPTYLKRVIKEKCKGGKGDERDIDADRFRGMEKSTKVIVVDNAVLVPTSYST
jgi:hypothetical protein